MGFCIGATVNAPANRQIPIASVVSCSFLHTTGGFEQSFKWLIENGYSEDVMKKILYNGGSLVVQIIDLGNEKITTNGCKYETLQHNVDK